MSFGPEKTTNCLRQRSVSSKRENMSIRRRRPGSPESRLASSAIVLLLSALLAVCARLPLRGDSAPQNSLRTSSSSHHLVGAFGQFPDDAGLNSLLMISEGNDGRGKMFKQLS